MDQAPFPLPAHEEERLQDLQELGLAGGEFDVPSLEPIPRVAANACDRPWAAVTIVQESSHRFLAQQGPFPDELPRSRSPCARAIAETENIYEIEDLSDVPGFREDPLVVEDPGVRFYAGAPIRSPRGYGLGTVCVFDDDPGELASGEREALAALSELVSLELTLHNRTRQLERANEELDRFTTYVSHELTDPISQVLGNLQLLEMDLTDVDEDTRELLDEALAGARRMERVTKDLLRYARASGRSLDRQPVDLEDLVDEVEASLTPRRGAFDAEIETGALPTVNADGDLLRRVLHNLVQNAIEHGDRPARIRVDADEEAEGWRVEVEDEGPGIPDESQEDLFELFEKGPASAGGSSGVGLALCKRIVERHGGEIGVDSAPGEGACFWFTIPRQGG